MIQWHPLFALLLRPLLEPDFEVRTGVPVGDAPRVADIVLVCRTSARPLPFHGLWQYLTNGNVLESKGPTVSPRRGDLERLIELGLGVYRRLNEERAEQGQAVIAPDEISFWYLANHLGRRFLRNARQELDVADLEPLGAGIWRCRVLRRLVFLVSGTDVPVDRDSLPMHVLGRESEETELAVARLVGAEPPLWETYGQWVGTFHPAAVEELRAMARTASKKFWPQMEPLIDLMGLEEIIRQVGPKRLLEQLGPKRVIANVTLKEFLAQLTPAQRRELKRHLEQDSAS